jgi:hypothetical protein
VSSQEPAGEVGETTLLGVVLRRRMWVSSAVAALAVVLAGRGDPADLGYFAAAGNHILRLDLAGAYADPGVQAGPFELVAGALVRSGPGLLVMQVLLAALTGPLALVAVRTLRRVLLLPPSPLVELLVPVAAALWLSSGAVQTTHAAEVAVPVTWVVAAVLLQRHPLIGGIVLASSTCWETWGALAAPMLLFCPTLRGALRASAGGAALSALVWGPFVLSGQFHMLELAWRIDPHSTLSLLGAAPGSFSWGLRAAQAGVSMAAFAGVALALGRRSPDSVWLPALGCLVCRLALDPLDYGYYWVALLVLALAGLGLTSVDRPLAGAVRLALVYLQALALGSSHAVSLALSLLAVGTFLALPRGGQTPRAGLSWRSRASRPLTKAGLSSVDRLAASSTASLTATASGTSGHQSSS